MVAAEATRTDACLLGGTVHAFARDCLVWSWAREFMRMIRERDFAAWPGWLEAAKSILPARFADHLARDQNAILAALRLPWSNGTVEGHVHRLKLIKRQMFGRAKFDLLRLRVLQTA